MNKPKGIIFSTTEALQTAKTIRGLLCDDFYLNSLDMTCDLWRERFMGENWVSALELLEKMTEEYNFAIVLFTQDDLTESRGEGKPSPRDNLVFELGLFLGALGRERTILLIESGNIKIPSDLHGVMPEKFELPPRNPATQQRDSRQLRSKIAPVCDKIIEKLHSTKWNLPPKTGYPLTLRRLRDCWRQYADQEKHEDFKLFTFCGISDRIAPRDTWDNSTNLEQIYHLWANAGKGSWIRARVMDAGFIEQCIRIVFSNKENGYPGNVAIRFAGQGLVATENGEQFKALRFKARIPPDYEALFNAEKPANDTTVALSNLGLNIRVIDALTTHWEYCCRSKGGEYNILPLTKGTEWEEFEIPLEPYPHWIVFESDGNYLYHSNRPDFSQIIAVVVEVGDPDGNRAGKGAGIVELKDFRAEQ